VYLKSNGVKKLPVSLDALIVVSTTGLSTMKLEPEEPLNSRASCVPFRVTMFACKKQKSLKLWPINSMVVGESVTSPQPDATNVSLSVPNKLDDVVKD
jgi:hypothetical protein